MQGNHEDGYLIGVDNLMKLFQAMGYDKDEFNPDAWEDLGLQGC